MGQIIFNRLDSEFRPDQRENTSEHNDVLGDSSPYFKIFITEISSSSYTTSGFYNDN